MSRVAYTPAEIVQRGEETVARDHAGHFVVLDIESGDFEVDPQDLAASNRLLARRPDAVPYGVRIGYPSAYRIGGGFRAPSA